MSFRKVSGRIEGMENYFKREVQAAILLDHNVSFQEKAILIETRKDLFDGSVARIVKFRWRPPRGHYDHVIIEKSKETCPFCPERINAATPKFSLSIAPEGRIQYGRVTVMPNAFPYSQYNAVVVFSDQHHLTLEEFSAELFYEAFIASLLYIERVGKSDKEVAHASINWNHMPPSGGGIIHPHLQIVVNREPTRFHGRLLHASLEYKKDRGRNYWPDLICFERQEEVRYLFHCGEVVFLTSFCPRGMFGDVLALFEGAGSLRDIKSEGWKEFAKGLAYVLSCFHKMNYDSINMTLLTNLKRDEDFWVQARILPRATIPPLGTSDVNYFEKGHDEIIAIISPEDLAGGIRKNGADKFFLTRVPY